MSRISSKKKSPCLHMTWLPKSLNKIKSLVSTSKKMKMQDSLPSVIAWKNLQSLNLVQRLSKKKTVQRKTAQRFVSLSSVQLSSLTASWKNLKMLDPLARLRDSAERSKNRPATWSSRSSPRLPSASSSMPVYSNECRTKTRMVACWIVQTPAIKSTNRSKMRFSTKFKLNCKICERLITHNRPKALKQAPDLTLTEAGYIWYLTVTVGGRLAKPPLTTATFAKNNS